MDAVKFAVDFLDVPFQFLRRAEEGLDMARLAGPATDAFLINDPLLLAHPVIERRAPVGREQIEVSHRDFFVFQEAECVRENLARFSVPAEDKIQGETNAAPA